MLMPMTRLYFANRSTEPLDLAPQAVLRVSIRHLNHDQGIAFENDEDDLGPFEAAYFDLDGHVIALIHHAGEPKSSVSVYLDRGLGPKKVKKAVTTAMNELGIDLGLLAWVETETLRSHPD
jgi:hypothetical protein